MRSLTLVLALVAVAFVARADDTGPLVALEAHGIFGDELLYGPGVSELVVEVASLARRPIRGEVRVTVDPFAYGGSETTYCVRVDLPRGTKRRAIVPVFVPRRGTTFRVDYVEDRATLARTTMSTGYDDLLRGVVVLANPARLRAGLLDLRVRTGEATAAAAGVEPPLASAPVGVVSYEPRSGEAIVPRTPEAYGSVALVIVTAAELEGLDEAAFATLRAGVEAGARLLVVPRDAGELAGPHVASLFGPLRLEAASVPVGAGPFVPEGLPNEVLSGPLVTSLGFGAERRLGFGRLSILRYDANAEPYDRAPTFRALVRALVEDAGRSAVDGPIFPLGRGTEGYSGYEGYGGPSELAPLLPLRQALDPNEAFEGAILIAGCFLFAYVIAVGPITFAFARRRNRPMLVLSIAPLLALAGLGMLVAVGFVGKGVSSRHRIATLLEVTEGGRLALERSYAGLFFTRPGAVTVVAGEGAMLRPIGSDTVTGARIDETELPPRVMGLRGNVWETRVLRYDGLRDLGGPIRFEGSNTDPVAVVNHSRQTLHDAVLLDDEGKIRRVGSVPPGARAEIGKTVVGRVEQERALVSLREARTRELAGLLGLPYRSRDLLEGLFAATRARLARSDQVVLLARLDASPRTLAGRFSEDRKLVLLRVAARPALGPLEFSDERDEAGEAAP